MPRFTPHSEETKRKIAEGQQTAYAKAKKAEALAKYWKDVHEGRKPMPKRSGRPSKTMEQRFWSKVTKPNGEDGCWIFISRHGHPKIRHSKAYGSINGNGGKSEEYMAHRISWLIHLGKIPNGMLVLHKCDNRKCVNPDHLFLGDHSDNMKDMVDKGRSLKGSKSPVSKLNEGDVLKIRKLYATGKYSQSKLAEMFGVIQNNISKIVCRRSWTHI